MTETNDPSAPWHDPNWRHLDHATRRDLQQNYEGQERKITEAPRFLRIPLDDTVDLSTPEGVEGLLDAIVTMSDDEIRACVRTCHDSSPR